MTEITAILVKELRERTGLGIMDCKNALTAVNGDIELAIENMRKSGSIKAAKKAGNLATEGLIGIKSGNGYALISEINCETDFVAKDINFQNFANKVLNLAVISKVTNVEYLKKQFEEERIALISRIGENINIRRIAILEGTEINSYQHGMHIGVLVSTKGVNKDLSKQIAMHIAASKPEFVNPQDINPNIIEKEYQIQFDIAIRTSKSEEIAKKIVVGRMKKFTEEISLIGQKFIFEPSKSVGQILKEKNANVIDFIRFEVGEGIITIEQN